ncbi:hypothetical protein LTR81_026775 [Elasticomyces elasticus]
MGQHLGLTPSYAGDLLTCDRMSMLAQLDSDCRQLSNGGDDGGDIGDHSEPRITFAVRGAIASFGDLIWQRLGPEQNTG